MNNRSNLIIALLAGIVLVLFAQTKGYSFQSPVVPPTVSSTAAAVIPPASPVLNVSGDDKWSGDLLGPEQPFPATATGPAIAEIYDQASGFCALIKINTGESLPWNGSGAFWQALAEGAQDAIDDRWPHQLQEYLVKPKTAHCYYFLSVAEFYAEILAEPTTAVVETADDKWSGDLLGPEQPFPATATGPAIAEIYDQASGFCALIKINTGESLPWNGSGAFWQALAEGAQDAIDDRWPHQLQEYLVKPKTAHCYYFLSVAEFWLENPTYR